MNGRAGGFQIKEWNADNAERTDLIIFAIKGRIAVQKSSVFLSVLSALVVFLVKDTKVQNDYFRVSLCPPCLRG